MNFVVVVVFFGVNCYYLFFKVKFYVIYIWDVLFVCFMVLLVGFLEIVCFCGSIILIVDNFLFFNNCVDFEFDGLFSLMVDMFMLFCNVFCG